MNYIRHLNKVFALFYDDRRLSSHHVSAYMALFHFWNMNRFEASFPIDRVEIMQAAKIGSLSTYSQVMRQLHEWGYIKYLPSHSPMIGSKVQLYTFDTTEQTTKVTTDEKTTVRPSIYSKHKENSINIGKNAPALNNILDFFEKEKIDKVEAEKFYNHFQSNGWKVGGKTPMIDWQAAARYWILNIDNFNTKPKSNEPNTTNHLHTQNNKNYGEPL